MEVVTGPLRVLTVVGLKEQPDEGIESTQVNAKVGAAPAPGVKVIVYVTSVPAFVVAATGFAASVVCADATLAIRQKTPTSHDPTKHFFIEITDIFYFS